jgi:transcriptional regulator with XRE-family HTH domain
MNQQEFLRKAMADLSMTRKDFANRLGCAQGTVDKWLSPEMSGERREMNSTMWKLVREILEHEQLKSKHQRLQLSVQSSLSAALVGSGRREYRIN